MKLRDHLDRVALGFIAPRVVERDNRKPTVYIAWTPTWEGPARPDYAAAYADLLDRVQS